MSESLPDQPDTVARLDRDLACHACGYNLRTLKPDQTCPECGAEVVETMRIEEQRLNRPPYMLDGFSIPARIVHLLLGVVLPFFPFCLIELNQSAGLTQWQSGRWNDYIGMVLGGITARPFYPFLLYAITALTALLFKPSQHGRKTWVVIGIITGVVLSLQYSLILFGTQALEALAISMLILPFVLLPAIILYCYSPASQKRYERETLRRKQQWVASIVIGFVLVGITLGSGGMALAIFVIFSPLFCLMIYSLTLARILRDLRLRPEPEKTLLKTIIPTSALIWLSGGLVTYFLAWVAAISLAIIEYAKLPTQPPNCYIATAAAKGHPRLVRSRPVKLSTGQTIHINRQLQTLKAAELALRATSPRLHRVCRTIYDRLGRALASRINHPILADLAYITLTPFALLATAILSRLIPDFHQLVSRLYRN